MDTPTLLAEFLAGKQATPFAWGTNDCCLFAADWCLAVGKGDPMADFRGRYSTAREAIALWRTVGGYAAHGPQQLESAGFSEVGSPHGFSRRGDIALFQSSSHHTAFGIIEGGGVWALTASGLSRLPMGRVLRAWRTN